MQAEEMAQWRQQMLFKYKSQIQILSPTPKTGHRPRMVAHAVNPSPQKGRDGGLCECQASLIYVVRQHKNYRG